MEKRINIKKLSNKDRDAIIKIRPNAVAIIERGVRMTKDDKLDLILKELKNINHRLGRLENTPTMKRELAK